MYLDLGCLDSMVGKGEEALLEHRLHDEQREERVSMNYGLKLFNGTLDACNADAMN